MRTLLIKMLLKVIGENPFTISKIDAQKMQDWLFNSFANDGYKQYYTLRKKFIQNELTIGMTQEEYWKRLGRMEELRALNDNIQREAGRRDREKKQHLTK